MLQSIYTGYEENNIHAVVLMRVSVWRRPELPVCCDSRCWTIFSYIFFLTISFCYCTEYIVKTPVRILWAHLDIKSICINHLLTNAEAYDSLLFWCIFQFNLHECNETVGWPINESDLIALSTNMLTCIKKLLVCCFVYVIFVVIVHFAVGSLHKMRVKYSHDC